MLLKPGMASLVCKGLYNGGAAPGDVGAGLGLVGLGHRLPRLYAVFVAGRALVVVCLGSAG